MKYPLHQAAIMGAIVLLLGGCAATADTGQLEASVATAQSTADSAKTIAIEARDTANRALMQAEEANATASSAKAIAENALDEARAASEKADRMYQKAVSK